MAWKKVSDNEWINDVSQRPLRIYKGSIGYAFGEMKTGFHIETLSGKYPQWIEIGFAKTRKGALAKAMTYMKAHPNG